MTTMVMTGLEAAFPAESVTCRVKPNVPTAVGVPLITPEDNCNPGGSVPLAREKV
jgi:hypothetical protein